jgi:hypothetical protein
MHLITVAMYIGDGGGGGGGCARGGGITVAMYRKSGARNSIQ